MFIYYTVICRTLYVLIMSTI